jgi:hypothetical protein
MKRCRSVYVAILVLLVLASAAQAAERTVVVPRDAAPFTVVQHNVVRLTGEAISGGNVTATVNGPARIESENIVSTVVNGHVLIGALRKEFDIRPTGKGIVKVTLTATSPIPNTQPTKTEYEFTVK